MISKAFHAARRLLILKSVACPADGSGVDASLSVQNRRNSSREWLAPKTVIGVFLLGIFVFLHVLAASEALHQRFHHHDDCDPEGSCVVTMLAHGLVEPSVADVSLPLITTCETHVSQTVEMFVGFPVSRLLPARAPPALVLA
jgi:hypothetical protein